MKKKFELVSFDLCPYVQRSVITLLHKKIDFDITYIDLENTPPWFQKISPLGKVPLLVVHENGNGEALFESAIINEYLDEVNPPGLLPRDPLQKAKERAWVEVSSELLGKLYLSFIAKEKAKSEEAQKELWRILDRTEAQIPGGIFFRGSEFSLVDAAFAPVFYRLECFASLWNSPHWKRLPKTRQWAESVLRLPEVRESVIPDFRKKFAHYLEVRGSALASDISIT